MALSKVKLYRSSDPGECSLISNVIDKHWVQIMSAGGFNYASMDMKVGVCVASLGRFATFLGDLIAIDPRGGYLSQVEIKSCVQKIAMKPANAEGFKAWCVLQQYIQHAM